LGFSEVASASNGKEAWALAEQAEFDVLLTDISMPYMNGFELASRVKAASPNTEIILLTVHESFEYAKKAIELGSFRYLTKPVDIDELAAVLGQAIASLDKKKRSGGMIGSGFLSISQILDGLFSGNTPLDLPASWTDQIGFNPLDSVVNCLLAKGSDSLDASKHPEWIEALRNLFCFEIPQNKWVIHSFTDGSVALLSIANPDQPALKTVLANLDSQIRAHIPDSGRLALGTGKTGQRAIRESYLEAVHAMDYTFLGGGEGIIAYEQISQLATYDMPKPNILEFQKKLAASDAEACIAIIEAYLLALRSAQPMTRTGVIIAMSPFYDRLIQFADDAGLDRNVIFSTRTDPAMILSDTTLIQWYREHLTNIAIGLEAKYKGLAREYVMRAEAYIREHHANHHLKLHDIARASLCSSGYLSTVFKKCTGFSVMDYINLTRVEHAKTLIKAGSLKFYEVAERVGFKDSHYFSTRFTETVGVTPSEYKKVVDFKLED